MSNNSFFKTILTCHDYDNVLVTINVKIENNLNSSTCYVSAYDSKLRYYYSHINLPYDDAIKKITTNPCYCYSELCDGTIALLIFENPTSWSKYDEDYALFENNEDDKHIENLT
jgi:hypothetical protein